MNFHVAVLALDFLKRDNRKRDKMSISGKTDPISIPVFRLSFVLCVTAPTRPGPKAPPRSPAMASNANMAVPPAGSYREQILIVPGHIIPTENPHKIQPTRPRTGLAEIEAVK